MAYQALLKKIITSMHFDLKGFPSFSVLREQVDAEECREYDPILVNNNEKKYQMVNTGYLEKRVGLAVTVTV